MPEEQVRAAYSNGHDAPIDPRVQLELLGKIKDPYEFDLTAADIARLLKASGDPRWASCTKASVKKLARDMGGGPARQESGKAAVTSPPPPPPTPEQAAAQRAQEEIDRATEIKRLAASAHELIHDREPWKRFVESARGAGVRYAGDTKPLLLVLLVGTSRLLARPLNVCFVNQSSTGKNHTVNCMFALFPEEAYYKLSAGSPRVLVYEQRSFKHVVVIIEELNSIPSDSPAASAVRSIFQDSKMVYGVVEQVEGRYSVRVIEKQGPTNLITTGTRALAFEMGTRTLTASLTEDAKSTREVLVALGRDGEGEMPELSEVDIQKFHDYQRWLALVTQKEPIVPYGRMLAEMVPAKAVRARRDFRQLLTVIKTFATMAQAHREIDDRGRIVATLDDYAAARELLLPVFDTIGADGVTPQIRETVKAVPEGLMGGMSLGSLALALGITKSAASYRVGHAKKGGWLVNSEARKGFPAKISRGDDLPDEQQSLPTVEELRARIPERDDSVFDEADQDNDQADERF